MLRYWSFAVFLLTILIPVEPKPTNTVSRQRRSVSHAQMMHDRSRSLQEQKRRLWMQELLEQVHTAQTWDSANHGERSFQNVPWAGIHPPKYSSRTKMFPLSFQLETVRTREHLTQETSKSLRYEPLKKRKICSKRRREPDRRDWRCAIHTHQTNQD